MASGFLSRPEAAIREYGFDVLAGRARERYFKIVDRRRSVHGEGCREAAVHEVDQNGCQAALDHMPAHGPDDRFVGGACGGDRIHDRAQRIGGEKMGQAREQTGDALALLIKTGKMFLPHLATACRQRDGFQR